MVILLLASAFNSLTQRVFAELSDRGHRVAVELALGEESVREALHRHVPDLVVAPMLTTAIPEDVCAARPCLVVHPGPPGDRGPSSLDRALQEGVERWGVTVFQAEAAWDAGPVWASASFAVPPGVGKSDLYRGEVADAALEAVSTAVERFAAGGFRPTPQPPDADGGHAVRPYLRQEERRIDWEREPTEAVLRKLRAADSRPGVRDAFLGGEWYLHGGHPEDRLHGRPGWVLATRHGAICRATVDGAVWIPELRPARRPGGPGTYRLPAVHALGDRLPPVPELPAGLWPSSGRHTRRTWTDVWYAEEGAVGFLRFSFPGGAMSTDQCRRVLAGYTFARTRPTEVLVLGGARDFFSNGIHLGVIEAAPDPAAESWANILAMDALVEAVLTTTDRLVVAALGGNAAAGGAMLALAADEVWCRSGAVLNPHYRLMGLYGSEYWTYTLPRRVGAARAERLTRDALPMSAAAAERMGLVDRVLESGPGSFTADVTRLAAHVARSAGLRARIAQKKATRERDEGERPLREYRNAELGRMRRTFQDPGAPYHALRRAFVTRERPVRTPEHLTARFTRHRVSEL
ncbi:enoyl-CoA hydratase-related protein [Streptomyces sp. LX-29]|uniref:enoyl-CoA hydratase-related protein n=1 Tax=Streptomyces sp. LX-29 TaxID=2900152 RepID=UPI00240D017F|nr:enoyl-CoA hydratase-related protein [Streptomyces sp. LX-29]WFB06357.1 enoyl-CoA hydratase-related protein [Streptomyces sp. LX-29]